MKAWGESVKLVHHYETRLLEWSSIKARMRGCTSNIDKHQSSGSIDFEDSSDDEQQTEQEEENAAKVGSKGEDIPQDKPEQTGQSKQGKDWEHWDWKPGNINAGDMRKRTSIKWNQFATIMDRNKLDGLATQEHRLTDDSPFVAKNLGHLKLFLAPCTIRDN